jgi:hypothetical protein
MFVPFDSLPSSSRIWVYQADRLFSENDELVMEDILKKYCEQWVAHGEPLRSSFKIAHRHFIILSIDETHYGASGCSIDTSVNIIKQIGSRTGIDFFDRRQIAFSTDRIFLIPVAQLKKTFSDGIWDEQTLTFDNLVETKGQLDTVWLKPAGTTWLKRYVPGETVNS